MNRRAFLKAAGMVSLAGLINLRLPPALNPLRLAGPLAQTPEIGLQGILLRADGARIFRSADGGRTWQSAVNFGPAVQVVAAGPEGDHFLAHLRLQGFEFALVSTDGRTWRTPEDAGFSKAA